MDLLSSYFSGVEPRETQTSTSFTARRDDDGDEAEGEGAEGEEEGACFRVPGSFT